MSPLRKSSRSSWMPRQSRAPRLDARPHDVAHDHARHAVVVEDAQAVQPVGVAVEPPVGCERVAGLADVAQELAVCEDGPAPEGIRREVVMGRGARVGIAEEAHLAGAEVPQAHVVADVFQVGGEE